ncbi:MAG: hypothetical protein ACE5HI_17120 [bacterium]
MKTIFSICFIMAITSFCIQTQAQELILMHDQERIQARKLDKSSWSFNIDGEEFLLMKKEDIASLTKQIKLLENDVERFKKVIDAKESLLNAFETYELKADEHIKTQTALIDTAESLYSGYKLLYNDVKKLIGVSTFSFAAGVGWTIPPEAHSRPVGSLGVGYQNWIALYQFGKKYHGISVLYRLPVGF